MKSQYKLRHNDLFSLPDNKQLILTVGEMKKAFEQEYIRSSNKMLVEIERKVTAQFMATAMTALNKSFGFGKKRLQEFMRSVEGLFIAMAENGIMGQKFDTQTCIDYMRTAYDIDIDGKAEDGGAVCHGKP